MNGLAMFGGWVLGIIIGLGIIAVIIKNKQS